jgi:hypothetical protein
MSHSYQNQTWKPVWSLKIFDGYPVHDKISNEYLFSPGNNYGWILVQFSTKLDMGTCPVPKIIRD